MDVEAAEIVLHLGLADLRLKVYLAVRLWSYRSNAERK